MIIKGVGMLLQKKMSLVLLGIFSIGIVNAAGVVAYNVAIGNESTSGQTCIQDQQSLSKSCTANIPETLNVLTTTTSNAPVDKKVISYTIAGYGSQNLTVDASCQNYHVQINQTVCYQGGPIISPCVIANTAPLALSNYWASFTFAYNPKTDTLFCKNVSGFSAD